MWPRTKSVNRKLPAQILISDNHNENAINAFLFSNLQSSCAKQLLQARDNDERMCATTQATSALQYTTKLVNIHSTCPRSRVYTRPLYAKLSREYKHL